MSAAERYPLAEHDPERVRSRSGRTLGDLSVEAIVAGEVAIEDLAIAPDGLRAQAEVARAAGRPTLARNFERAAELVTVPEAAAAARLRAAAAGPRQGSGGAAGGSRRAARGARCGAERAAGRGGRRALRAARPVPQTLLSAGAG